MDRAHDKRQINMQVEQSPDGTWTAELLFPVVGVETDERHAICSCGASAQAAVAVMRSSLLQHGHPDLERLMKEVDAWGSSTPTMDAIHKSAMEDASVRMKAHVLHLMERGAPKADIKAARLELAAAKTREAVAATNTSVEQLVA